MDMTQAGHIFRENSQPLHGNLIFFREGSRRGPKYRTDPVSSPFRTEIYASPESHIGLHAGESLIEKVEIVCNDKTGAITIRVLALNDRLRLRRYIMLDSSMRLCVGETATPFRVMVIRGRQTLVPDLKGMDKYRWRDMGGIHADWVCCGPDGKEREEGTVWCEFFTDCEWKLLKLREQQGVTTKTYPLVYVSG